MYTNQCHNLNTLNLKPEKNVRAYISSGYRLKGCQGQDPAFRGLQGTFNAVGEFGIWKNHRPLTVPWAPYRQHYIFEAKEQAAPSYAKLDHQKQSRCLTPNMNFVKAPVSIAHYSSLFFLLCFLQIYISFQQDEKSSVIILNVLKCLLEICHPG